MNTPAPHNSQWQVWVSLSQFPSNLDDTANISDREYTVEVVRAIVPDGGRVEHGHVEVKDGEAAW